MNSDDNSVLVVAGQTLSGGAGHDKLRIRWAPELQLLPQLVLRN